MENVSLIDVSFEDDLLIPSFSQGFGTHIILETENIEKASRKLEQAPKPSDSPDQDQSRYDRHHLRKSLAWDSAFFTSEGILNSEELEIMNGTYCKSGITLPRIQEELRKSSESTSTLESDSRALEQLEVNLFENVRVSIQKTLGSSNCSRMMVHSDKVKEAKKPDAHSSRSLEKIDVSSKIKSKTPIASRRHFVSKQQKEHTSKDRLVCVSMPSLANSESKPLIKPTKVSCKTILPPSVPSKKAEIKRNAVKPLPAAKQQSAVAFNKSIEAPGITRGTALSTKSKTPKSSKIGYTGENCRPFFTRSSLVLSKASPTSSVDSVISASSSTTTSASINLGKSFEGSDAGSLSPPLSLSSSVGAYKYSGSLSRSCVYDRSKSDVNGDSGAKLAKPSGLRIPRPTVGYFDKEKCLIRGSSKAPKPSLPSNASRNSGVNYISTANKMRPSDPPTLRDRGLSKHALKSAEAHGVLPTSIENHPELCPKVNNISSVEATNIRKVDSRDEEVTIHDVSREQRIPHQSYIIHIQEENVKNEINAADRETGRAVH